MRKMYKNREMIVLSIFVSFQFDKKLELSKLDYKKYVLLLLTDLYATQIEIDISMSFST